MAKGKGLFGIVGGVIVHAALLSLVINVLLLTTPLYMMQVYDRVLPSSNFDTLLYISLIALAALLFLGVVETVRSIYFQRLAGKLDSAFGPPAFQAGMEAGAVGMTDMQPMRDLVSMRNFLLARGLATIFDLPFVPFFAFILFLVHPLLFWLTVAGIVVLLSVALLNQVAIKSRSAKASEKAVEATKSAQSFAAAGESMRAMGMQRNAIESWGNSFAESTVWSDRTATVNAVFSGISRTARIGLQMAILGAGALLTIRGEITGGMIFASSILAGRALQPIDQMIGGWRLTVEGMRAWKRLSAMHNRAAAIDTTKSMLPAPKGAITVRDLVYVPHEAPKGSDPVIKRLNFTIEPGQTVAIVGPSRAGKSTLVKLMVGALVPSGGEVLVDGTRVGNWNEAQWGATIGYLGQDMQLIPGTVAENIGRFDPDASDEAITAAAQRAQAYELITSLRRSFQTRVGDATSALSGGERQRIALARAFYGNPRILILDEPNLNLDAEGDASLETALADARAAGTTIVIVTHRISVAAKADRIMALRNGAIEAYGPADQVMQQLSKRRAEVTPLRRVDTQARQPADDGPAREQQAGS